MFCFCFYYFFGGGVHPILRLAINPPPPPHPKRETCFRVFLISASAFSPPHHYQSEEKVYQVKSKEGNISSFQPPPHLKAGAGKSI